jgi:peptidoglycan LD-endopeptidase LytH
MGRGWRRRTGAVVCSVLLAFAVGACTSGRAAGSATSSTPGSPTRTPGGPGTSPPAHPLAATPGPSGRPGSVRYVFPVVGTVSYAHTHHDYPATDIMAPCGTRVRASTSGVVLEVQRVDLWDSTLNAGPTRGGLSVSILGDDGVRYYGSHLSAVVAGIKPGVRVSAGQSIGAVGQTGDASACHLHFGISAPCQRTGDWWNRRGMIWPWPYLDSWRAGGSRSPVAEVTRWVAAHGCPNRPLVDP